MDVVIDTNVLVSALWSRSSKPAIILNEIIARRLRPCYDYRIINEYRDVLNRPKFKFPKWQIEYLLDFIIKEGISVIPEPLPQVDFTDESDKKFFEVAKYCNALLITGNIKHYPQDESIITVADFYDRYMIKA